MLSSSILAVITLETHITVPRIRLDALLSGNFVIPLTLSVTGPLPLRSLTASFVSLSVESRHPIPITFDLGFLLNSGGKALSHAKRALGEICQRATGAGDEAFEQEVKAGLESILSLAITQRRYYKEAVSCQMEGEGSLRTVVVGGKMRARCGFPERMSASHQNCFVNQIYGIRLEAEFSRGMVAVHFPVEVR